MKLITLLSSLYFSLPLFASCCICQTDNEIDSEIPFYELGCQIWLTGKFCSFEKMVDIDEDLNNVLPNECDGKKVKIGYVGHWSSSWRSERFIESRIMPLIKERKMSVEIDNTACSATSDTVKLQEFILSLNIPLDQYLKFKGNQVTSTGLWRRATPWKENFYSIADSRYEEAQFPKCSEFEDRTCSAEFQKNESAKCSDDNSGDIRSLQCCFAEYEFERSEPRPGPRRSGRREQVTIETTGYAWVDKARCLSAEDYEGYGLTDNIVRGFRD